ncbi:MAG: hypothetical protein U9N85_08795 [Bacteroidota bacterium]|nr:hypothetical protein [Bacteroidota bacterium]
MTSKKIIYAGIIQLILGILLKNLTDIPILPMALIISGVLFKSFYITQKIIRKEYKPGAEFILLAIGLGLFFTGIYAKTHPEIGYSLWLIISGGSLKALFVIIFILKARKQSRVETRQ